MHLTRHTDFALRLLIHLGRQQPGSLLRISAISAEFSMPHSHLSKIVNRLSHLGYVKTLTGRNGGICLAEGAGNARLGSLVEQIEHNTLMIDCQKPACPVIGQCTLPPKLREATRAFFDSLNRYTLADLIGESMTAQSDRVDSDIDLLLVD